MEEETTFSPAEQFSSGVAHLLMETEELRRSVQSTLVQDASSSTTIHQLMEWKDALENTLMALDSLGQLTQDAVGAPVETDLYHHCRRKAVRVAQQTLEASFQFQEPSHENSHNDNAEHDNYHRDDNHDDDDMPPPDVIRRDGQGAIARITELNLLLYHSFANPQSSSSPQEADTDAPLQSAENIVDAYVGYQKRILRLRVRPAIAELVEARRTGIIVTFAETTQTEGIKVQVHEEEENDKEEENKPNIRHFHAPVFTVILGEASALIHPLMQWTFSLPPHDKDEPPIVSSVRKLCGDTIQILDEQTQQLVKRVSDWYWEDRPIDEWTRKSAELNVDAPSEDASSPEEAQRELGILDGIVEEMAFSCQLLSRYDSLLHPLVQQLSKSAIASELLPEWNFKYATLERFLAVRQWQSALETATPVQIVLGTEVQVPSVVEDAQYLSTRALERAASTRSLQAIGTVAHAVTHDVWSVELPLGVHQALLDQRGCWSQPKKKEDKGETEKDKAANGGFASALLEALDDDISKAGPPKSPPKAPNSGGGFLNAIVSTFDDSVLGMQMETHFCVLNGLYAASASCKSLVSFLDSLLEDDDDDSMRAVADNGKSTSMIQLAREELNRFEGGYQSTLQSKVVEIVEQWCGSGNREDACPPNFRGKALDHLRYFVATENFNLNAASFAKAEADERLDQYFLGPLKESAFLKNMGNKCDNEVLGMVAKRLVAVLTQILREAIWESESQVTDWGSLLVSKELRQLQDFVAGVATSTSEESMPPNLFQAWEPLSQFVAVLQLEKPADWLAYQSTSVFTPDELKKTLSKRAEFSAEAVQGVVSQTRIKE